MGPFLAEFAKMQQALRKSHESEARFVSKCRELAQGLHDVNDRSAELDAEEIDHQRQVDVLQRQVVLADEQKAALQSELVTRHESISVARSELGVLRKKMETWSQVECSTDFPMLLGLAESAGPDCSNSPVICA